MQFAANFTLAVYVNGNKLQLLETKTYVCGTFYQCYAIMSYGSKIVAQAWPGRCGSNKNRAFVDSV